MDLSRDAASAPSRRAARRAPPAPPSADAARVATLCAPSTDFEAGLLATVRALAPVLPGGRGGGARARAAALADALRASGYIVALHERAPCAKCGGSHSVVAGDGKAADEDRAQRPAPATTAAVAAGRGGGRDGAAGGRGAGGGRRCLENLSHTYAVVTGSLDTAVVTEIVVEPDLVPHFVIAQPTPRYAALLAAAPPEFVGPPTRMAALVDTLAGGAAAAFEEQGLPLPPWRRAKSLRSKWGLPDPPPAAATAAPPTRPPPSISSRPPSAAAKRDEPASRGGRVQTPGKRLALSAEAASPPLPSLPAPLAAYASAEGGRGGSDDDAAAAPTTPAAPTLAPTPPPDAAAAGDAAARRVSLLARGLSRLSPASDTSPPSDSEGKGVDAAAVAVAATDANNAASLLDATADAAFGPALPLPSLGNVLGLAPVKSVRPRGRR